MSEFAKKYDLKESSMKALIKDGWLSCSIISYEEVVIHYRESKSMQKTADHFNVSKKHVYDIVHRLT
jgi:hypothetical protein